MTYVLDSCAPYLTCTPFVGCLPGARRVQYNTLMNKSNVTSVNENSPEFIADLKRRVAIAKNPKNRIQLDKSKKNILQKYRKLVRAAV